jgi:hypothetical protein
MTYAMRPSYNGDRIPRAIDGAEASRRVAWAKFYEELDHAQRLQVVNAMLRARTDDLVSLLLELTDSVLHSRNLDAFALAYKVKQAVEDFLARNGTN